MTVTKDATSTAVSVTPSSVGLGGSVDITATVSSAHGTPTGSVAFSDGSLTLCTAALTTGTAHCTGTEPASGTYTVTGTYSGDTMHARSSGSTTLTVGQDSSQLAITVSPTTVSAGQGTTFTATVSASYGTPTGTVAFSDSGGGDSGALCIADLSAGTGQCTGTITVPGDYTVYATYSGDQSYDTSSATSTLTVDKDTTTTTATVSPATITVGASTTLSATVSAPYGTPTGTVTFYRTLNGSQDVLCTATLSAGSAQCTATPSAGIYQVAASYSGDGADYASGTSTPVALTVNPASTTTTISVNPGTVLNDGTVTLSATVTAASGPTPTGAVFFRDPHQIEICAATLTNGHGSCSGVIGSDGNTQIVGDFSPDNGGAPSSGVTTVNVVASTSYIQSCVTVGNNDKESQTPVLISISSPQDGNLFYGYVSQNQYWQDGYTNCASGQYWEFTLPKLVATSSLANATFYVYAPGDSWHGEFQAWAQDNFYGLEPMLETVANMYYNDNGNLDPCAQYIGYDESAYTFTIQRPGSQIVPTCGVAG